MEPGKPPFKKRIFIKNYNEFKDKINQKAKYLVDDFKRGDKYVTQRVRQMMVTSQDYIRQKDIQGKMRKIDWVKGVKALILILVIFGAIASQNPVLFKTVVQAVVVATNDMKNLAGLKAILPVFRTIFTSLGNMEKIMIFVNIFNIVIDDIPGAITTWKYDKSSLSSYTRKALTGTLKASKIYESIKYTDNKEEQDKKIEKIIEETAEETAAEAAAEAAKEAAKEATGSPTEQKGMKKAKNVKKLTRKKILKRK